MQRHLIALVCSAAVVTGVLAMFVRDTGLVQVVTEEPVAPMQVVVVVRARVEQDAGQLSEVVEAVVHVDDRVESQPPVPDLLDQLAAGMCDGKVDIERWPVWVRRVGRGVVVDELGPDVALDGAVGASGQMLSRYL